jgi:hypothetical protein
MSTVTALSEIHSRINPDGIRQNIALIQNRQTRITELTDEIARLEKDPHLYQDAASREASKNSLYHFLRFLAGILAGGGQYRTIDEARDDLKSEAQELRSIKRELELSRNALLTIKNVESARLIGDIEQTIAPIKV